MTPDEYRAALSALGLTQGAAARLLGVELRTSYRYADGTRPVSGPVERLLRLFERHPELMQAADAGS